MEAKEPGLLETEPLHEVDEEAISDIDISTFISDEEREELKTELVKLEDEIQTLRQVLAAKEKHLVEIKQKLGVNPLNELRQNFSKGWHDMQTMTARWDLQNTSEKDFNSNMGNKAESRKKHYKKTQETLSHAGQKATAALSNVGSAITKKFGDMRNSPTFKSFEEKMENTVTSFKTKVGGTSNSGGSFEEVLTSTAHASAQDSSAGTRLPENDDLQC